MIRSISCVVEGTERALTFVRLQERVRQGKGDKGGDGKNEIREELTLISCQYLISSRDPGSATCSS